MSAITDSPLPSTQQAALQSHPVVFVPQQNGLEATACEQGFDITPHAGDLESTAKSAPLTYRMGYQSSSGKKTDYYSQLSGESQKKLVDILNAYSGGNPHFSIDVTHLVDGNGYPLKRALKCNEKGQPLEPAQWRDLKADLKTLRDIAQEANGPTQIHWDIYPEGWRAVVGHKPAFALDHSERLKGLHFENEHLEQWLESLRTVQAPSNDKPAAQMEQEALERLQVALARYHASLASMKFIKNALTSQIKHLETQRGEPDVGARIQKLQKVLDQLPDANVPENEKEQKTMRDNGQLTKRWVVLFGSTHMLHVLQGESIDLEKMEQDVREAVEKVPKPLEDCEGLFARLTPQAYKDLSENNKAAESRFIKSVVLLGAKDRGQYEQWRRNRKAEETSDGPELFNVQLADVMAKGKSGEEVEAFMHDSSLQIALSDLDEKDIPDCRKYIQERAGKWHSELQRVSGEFTKTVNWQDMSTHELCTRFEQLIRTPD